MTHPSAAAGVTRRPFPEQVAYFRRKLGNLVPTRAWDDMLGAAHDDGFMVAGAMHADLLTDLATAVDKAIAEGLGVEAFRRDFRAIVARHGWTGWTGEGTRGGEAWRVKTILRTNAYTSYAAGRRAQLDQGDFAWWVYRHGGSLEPRIMHLSWDGVALAPDDDFWTTHYPPSDWGCSCYVLGARSEAGVRRLGGDPDKILPPGWDAINPKTGAPQGVGRGWGYAPGAIASPTVQAMAAKVGNWDYQTSKAFTDLLPPARADALARAYRALPSTADDVRRYAQRVITPQPDLPPLPPVRTLGPVGEGMAERFTPLVGRDARLFDFVLDEGAVRHAMAGHRGDPIPLTAEMFGQLGPALNAVVDVRAGVLPRGYTAAKSRERVVVRSEIDGLTIETVWEVRPRRRSLWLITAYVVGRASA